jgi:hypothetical protein
MAGRRRWGRCGPVPTPAPPHVGGRGSSSARRGVSGGQQRERELESALVEREQTVGEYKETVEILELKIAKLEQLVRLKDSKISKLQVALSRQQDHYE